eukprot:gene12259-66353_t
MQDDGAGGNSYAPCLEVELGEVRGSPAAAAAGTACPTSGDDEQRLRSRLRELRGQVAAMSHRVDFADLDQPFEPRGGGSFGVVHRVTRRVVGDTLAMKRPAAREAGEPPARALLREDGDGRPAVFLEHGGTAGMRGRHGPSQRVTLTSDRAPAAW